MNTHAEQTRENESRAAANRSTDTQGRVQNVAGFTDNRPVSAMQQRVLQMANESQNARQFNIVQQKAEDDDELIQGKFDTVQKKVNDTGLPDNLKSGVEQMSGYSMDDVRVHYNSSKPADLNALAYTQGTDIHVAPGQERHLPHEAWHVVQQMQGRVKPTMQLKGGVNVNDDAGLEKEADERGRQVEYRLMDVQTTKSQAKLEHKLYHQNLPLQYRIKKNNIEYSFLSAYDLNGNPYLSSKQGENDQNWKISETQNNIALDEVTDLHTDLTVANQNTVYHNLSLGRQQRVIVNGQKAIFEPFKSYSFNEDSLPEVAVYNIKADNEVEKAKIYLDYKNQITTAIKDIKDPSKLTDIAANIKQAMMPLIFAENFRTPGAKDEFEKIWDELVSVLGTKNKNKINQAIKKSTTELPWAGNKGKTKYREAERKRRNEELTISPCSVGRRSVSPDRDDTGREWKKGPLKKKKKR